MKKLISAGIGIISAAALLGSATALAASLDQDAARYIETRLGDTSGLRMQAVGEPYQVRVDLNGGEDETCWAQDMRVRTSLASGGTGRERMTVIFYEDRAVALKRDLRTRMTRLDSSATQYAQN